MSARDSKQDSRTNWAYVDALTDDMIDTSDIPPLDEAFFSRATLRPPRLLVPVTVHLDPDILAWFQSQGEDYERRLNAALRLYVEVHESYNR